MQHYSDPSRASEPTALPDLETFYLSAADIQRIKRDNGATCADAELNDDDMACYAGGPGWYYWFCLPGCLPDSEPAGPYATEADALTAAREEHPDDDTHTESRVMGE